MARTGLSRRRRSIQKVNEAKSEPMLCADIDDFAMMDSESNVSLGTVQTLIKSIHRGRKSSSTNKRLIHKNGEFNISQKGIKKRKQQYLADIFTTLIDLKWRWSLVLFITAFLTTWLLFGLIWWVIAYSHGDIANSADSNWTQCVTGVNSYVTALLFSIETQHTIGYGTRSITETCPEAIVTMMAQSTFGVIIQALMTGLIFAKLARPQKRAETLMFSKKAVICSRNGQLVLLIRVGDMRSSHIIGAQMDALLIRRKVTAEGEVIPLEMENVDLGFANNRLLLRWPVIIEHRINKRSPFWKMGKSDFEKENFEFLVILEGSVPSTGASTQAMTSYLPEEIEWGSRFERLVTNQRDDGKYLFDYTRFHATQPVEIQSCSAEELATTQKKQSVPKYQPNTEEPTSSGQILKTNIDNWMLDRPPVGFTFTAADSSSESTNEYTVKSCKSVQAFLDTAERICDKEEDYFLIRVKCSDVQTDAHTPLPERGAKLCQPISEGQSGVQTSNSSDTLNVPHSSKNSAYDISRAQSLTGEDNPAFDYEEDNLNYGLRRKSAPPILNYSLHTNSPIQLNNSCVVDMPSDIFTNS